MAKKKNYKKPQIKLKKVKISFFSSKRFIDSAVAQFIPPVFAQSSSQTGFCECFLAGTKILMADGSTMPIEEVKEGGMVSSFNTDSKKIVENKVAKLIIHDEPKGGYILVNNILKVTGEHPLYINGEWIEADNLKQGDKLLNQSGEEIEVESVEHKDEYLDKVYNLEIEEVEHNYFAEGILVHNKVVPCAVDACWGGGGPPGGGGADIYDGF